MPARVERGSGRDRSSRAEPARTVTGGRSWWEEKTEPEEVLYSRKSPFTKMHAGRSPGTTLSIARFPTGEGTHVRCCVHGATSYRLLETVTLRSKPLLLFWMTTSMLGLTSTPPPVESRWPRRAARWDALCQCNSGAEVVRLTDRRPGDRTVNTQECSISRDRHSYLHSDGGGILRQS